MRHIPNELAARLESRAATMCHVWVVRRADGVVLGFTDHDRELTLDDVTCRAASGWTLGAGEAEVGFAGGGWAVAGGLDHADLTEADILAGAWDQAAVELWRVDWARPGLRVRLWAGRLARIMRDGDGFRAELEGPLAALERVVGRTYGRDCDARLGDVRCGVDLTAHPGATCDKRFSTCVEVFGNGLNFRGFPDVPGDDFLAAYPVEGGRHDGGSRR